MHHPEAPRPSDHLTARGRREREMALFKAHMPIGSGDETLIVLKGHLLIERMLTDFLESEAKRPGFVQRANLDFASKTWIARAYARRQVDSLDWAWEAIGKLNTMRNDFAHELVPKQYAAHREQFISLVEKKALDYSRLESHPAEALILAIFWAHSSIALLLWHAENGLMQPREG
jgi:hypothetical protein